MVFTSSLFIVFGPALTWQYFLRPSIKSTNSISIPEVVEAYPSRTVLQNFCSLFPKVVLIEVPSTLGYTFQFFCILSMACSNLISEKDLRLFNNGFLLFMSFFNIFYGTRTQTFI